MLASEREQQKAKEASEKALQKAEEELRQLQAKLNDLEYAQRRQIHSGRFSRGGFDSSRLGFKRSLEDGDAAKQGSAYKKGRDGGDSRGERDREDIRCKCGACGKSDRMYQDCKDSQAKKRLAREVHKNPDKYPHGLKKLVLEEFKQPPKTPSSSPRRSKSSSQLRRSSPAAAAKPDEGQQQRQEAATTAQEQAAEAELPFGVNFENSDSEDLEQSANGFSSS